ncbi:unnamed protein product [Symbiodinium natans]|uniref:Uncharacterized protein n=1 Tax=Symbiodinium natans TaxID=878477 RepID=A0A812SM47_9DINO|nr:unnamed protein product [Symbiodinium natans]
MALAEAATASDAATAPEAKRRKGPTRPLPVFVCEYHDEALRFLHFCIRRRKIPFADLAMVHLDAHPDLSASTKLEADRIYEDPHEVYASLRKENGGIAQWILPAAYGGHLRSVWWVRPPAARQISDGFYGCHVGCGPPGPKSGGPKNGAPDGDAEATAVEGIKISCTEPYFVEDGIYSPQEALRNTKPLDLTVSLLPEDGQPLPAWRSAGGAVS